MNPFWFIICWLLLGEIFSLLFVEYVNNRTEYTNIHIDEEEERKILFIGAILGPFWILIIVIALIRSFGIRQ